LKYARTPLMKQA